MAAIKNFLLSYLIIFLIKLRGISKITKADIINRCIRSKCKVYMGDSKSFCDCRLFRKPHLLRDPRQVRKLGWVDLQRSPTHVS